MERILEELKDPSIVRLAIKADDPSSEPKSIYQAQVQNHPEADFPNSG